MEYPRKTLNFATEKLQLKIKISGQIAQTKYQAYELVLVQCIYYIKDFCRTFPWHLKLGLMCILTLSRIMSVICLKKPVQKVQPNSAKSPCIECVFQFQLVILTASKMLLWFGIFPLLRKLIFLQNLRLRRNQDLSSGAARHIKDF